MNDASSPAAIPAPRPRHIGPVNWRGLAALYRREVVRFLKVGAQTVGAPVVMSLLFFAIFEFALGGVRTVGDIEFVTFLAPGLVMMAMMQNAFANTSSSILVAKMQGNIADMLMPPLSATELTLGFAAGGVTRGLVVGLATGLALWAFVPLTMRDAGAILLFAVLATTMLALAGQIVGIWAEKFDHVSAFSTFLVVPLSFLSGTFYSIETLPPFWQAVAHGNPFFFAIDGFRYGFLGRADADLWVGAGVLVAIDLLLGFCAWRMIARGHWLKG